MDPLNSISKRILRFSGVQPQVLKELETQKRLQRFQDDATSLFGETPPDVFVKSNNHSTDNIVDLVADSTAEKSLSYLSGALRALNRALTGQDIKPTPITSEQTVNLFTRTINKDN